MLGHLDPLFIDMLEATGNVLRQIWGTGNERTLPLHGTGWAGMEAAFVNTVGAGDAAVVAVVAVVAVNGLFGERRCEVARRTGAKVVRVDHAWGQPINPEHVLSAHPTHQRHRSRSRRDIRLRALGYCRIGPTHGQCTAAGRRRHLHRRLGAARRRWGH